MKYNQCPRCNDVWVKDLEYQGLGRKVCKGKCGMYRLPPPNNRDHYLLLEIDPYMIYFWGSNKDCGIYNLHNAAPVLYPTELPYNVSLDEIKIILVFS